MQGNDYEDDIDEELYYEEGADFEEDDGNYNFDDNNRRF
jgi:hypothetical protein